MYVCASAIGGSSGQVHAHGEREHREATGLRVGDCRGRGRLDELARLAQRLRLEGDRVLERRRLGLAQQLVEHHGADLEVGEGADVPVMSGRGLAHQHAIGWISRSEKGQTYAEESTGSSGVSPLKMYMRVFSITAKRLGLSSAHLGVREGQRERVSG